MNAEVRLVSLLNASTEFKSMGLSASLDVPETRPETFVTVERTSGDSSYWQDNPTFAVQVWAKRSATQSPRLRAGTLADNVAAVIRSLRDTARDVYHVDVSSAYNFPDTESDSAMWGRYQLVVSISFQ